MSGRACRGNGLAYERLPALAAPITPAPRRPIAIPAATLSIAAPSAAPIAIPFGNQVLNAGFGLTRSIFLWRSVTKASSLAHDPDTGTSTS
jgi:hypothetical protein